MSAVAIIPAKGTSRRIPGKNKKLFHGKPIIAYSIEAARESGLFDFIIVSTDDVEIAEIATDYDAMSYARTPALCEDAVGTQEVAKAVLLDELSCGDAYDYACCIYATAPMMTAEDLLFGFTRLRGWPHFGYVKVDGWYYWGKSESFLDGTPLDGALSIKVDTDRYIDINTERDWDKAEEMYAKLHGLCVPS